MESALILVSIFSITMIYIGYLLRKLKYPFVLSILFYLVALSYNPITSFVILSNAESSQDVRDYLASGLFVLAGVVTILIFYKTSKYFIQKVFRKV